MKNPFGYEYPSLKTETNNSCYNPKFLENGLQIKSNSELLNLFLISGLSILAKKIASKPISAYSLAFPAE